MTMLYPYQKLGVKAIERLNGRALLADEMGLGKTIQVLEWMKRHPEARPAIIVTPGSLKWHWEVEAKKHIGMLTTILEGMSPSKFGFTMRNPVYVINYEILGAWLPHLKALKPKLVVFDEGQYIKNPTSQRTQYSTLLAESVKHVIIVTGTPITNLPADIWPLLHIIKPEKYRSFEPFAFQYCKPEKKYGRWVYRGSANLAVLHAELHRDCMIRRRKMDVLKDLPARNRVIIPLQVPAKERREYDDAYARFRSWLQGKATTLQGQDRNHAFGELTKLRVLVGRMKIPSVLEWIENFHANSDDKLITFVVHKGMSKAIMDKLGTSAVLVDGDVPTSKRQPLFEKFQQDKRCTDFVGNIQAAGAGWNGTVAATTLHTEMAWVPGLHKQAEDRTHRIGQTKVSFNYYLVVQNTIEEKICQKLQEKHDVIDQIIDGGNLDDKMNIFDDLVRAIYKEAA